MKTETWKLDPDNLGQGADWYGNTAAFTCPPCGKVFIVSAMFHNHGRKCPACGGSKGYVKGGNDSGGEARIQWPPADGDSLPNSGEAIGAIASQSLT